MGGNRDAFDGFGGAEDRRVPGTAAEVTSELVVVIRRAVGMSCGHRDRKTGRAKAALAAVMGNEGILSRMGCAIWGGEAFDRCDGFAIDLW